MMNMLLDGAWYDIIVDAVDKLLGPILIVFASIGIIYAIVIGVKMMKAESKEDRENNKARLINIAITIIAVVALIAIFYALRSYLMKTENVDKLKDIVDESASKTRLWFK